MCGVFTKKIQTTIDELAGWLLGPEFSRRRSDVFSFRKETTIAQQKGI
jgi:hypothetical protein